MAAIYNRSNDDDLSFRLKRSIELAKEQQMARKKESKERAAVGRERRLALELRALLDELQSRRNQEFNWKVESLDAELSAEVVLTELSYGSLEGIPRRVAKLNEQLKAAVEAGDGKEIARLGTELERAQKGLPPSKSASEASNG